LTEHTRTTKRRSYRKTKRAQDERATRARIVDAAEILHASVGPARTNVSAIAEAAGVTRATVYRHFPDEESLFVACSAQWLSRQRRPDPDAWTAHSDGLERLRTGLRDIYRYYRDGEQMLRLVIRDREVIPDPVVAARAAAERQWVDTLLAPFPRRSRTIRAAVAHATTFRTWESLCVDGGLSDRTAADLMVGMVGARVIPEGVGQRR
jgi:AcrR family transcriptional regulator